MGKLLILVGLILIITGLVMEYSDKIPYLGKLPGDFVIDKGNVKFYFPLATSVLLSVLLTLILYVIKWLKN